MVLSKCGRPLMPQGVVCVPWPKKYLYQKFFTNPATVPPYPPDSNEAIEVAGDTEFRLKALSGMVYGGVTPTPGPLQNWPSIYLQIQLPSGRMMSNLLEDAAPYAGFGSGRLVWNTPIACPPRSKLFVTIDSSISGFSGTMGNFTVMLLFEGALYYYLQADASTPPKAVNPADSAAAQPRFYYRSPNQNILAPEHVMAGLDGEQCHPETPPGLEDDAFTYSNTGTSAQTAVFSESAPVATTIVMQISEDADFLTRRVMFNLVVGDVAPTFFGRIRTSLGGPTSLCDDYVVLNNMRIPKSWPLRKGMQVYIDVYAISNGGTGNTTLYVYLEGCKRRAAA